MIAPFTRPLSRMTLLQPFELDEIFTLREADERGLTRYELDKLLQSGEVARVARGVYRAGACGELPDPLGITRAMNAALSHDSGAAWFGADLVFAPTELHVTAARNRGRRSDCVDKVRLHRADVPSSDLVTWRGVLTTTPARTILDLARSMPLAHAVAVGDSMCRQGLVTPDEVMGTATRLPRGIGRPAAVAAAGLLDGRAESVFESISRVNVVMAGLPAPTPQVNVFGRDGSWIGRVDFAWVERRVVLECDGWEFHRSRDMFEADRRRWTALARAGWKVAVVTWHDVVSSADYLVEVMSDFLA